MKIKIITSVTLLLVALALFTPLLVKGACRVIYGGGLKKDGTPYCMEQAAKTPAPMPAQAQQEQKFMEQQNMMTKGGLPIYPAGEATQMPNTGPEMLPMLGLIPAGLFGLLLRKFTNKQA